MNTDRSVKVKDIVEKFQMEVLYPGADFETETLTITDVNRPGLQFVGFFDYFDPRRLQIIGKAETMFLKSFSSAERRKCFEDLFKYEIPALVISRKLDVFPECMEMAQKYGRTLLRTEHTSVEFTSMTIDFLNHELAPMITRHGVLMDVYGEGVLILGDSGIGKSETAIELIKRGHRLVADDAVEIRRIGDTLTGTAPELIRHYLEVRGIGVVDIQKLFGAIRMRQEMEGAGWLALSGLVSIIFAVMIVSSPGSGALAVVWIIGMASMAFGATLVGFAFRLRKRGAGAAPG